MLTSSSTVFESVVRVKKVDMKDLGNNREEVRGDGAGRDVCDHDHELRRQKKAFAESNGKTQRHKI